MSIFNNFPSNSKGKWNATYMEQQIQKTNYRCGNSILPCPIKTRKLQRTSPPFSQTIFPTFWRLLGCQSTRLWVDRFVRAPCCLKTILCAANDLWTQKNLTLSLVKKWWRSNTWSIILPFTGMPALLVDALILKDVFPLKIKRTRIWKTTIPTNKDIYKYF